MSVGLHRRVVMRWMAVVWGLALQPCELARCNQMQIRRWSGGSMRRSSCSGPEDALQARLERDGRDELRAERGHRRVDARLDGSPPS